MRRWLVSQLSARHKKILSIGCGSGELESDVVKLGRQVTGMDICFEMLQLARERGVKAVVQADALMLPFASSSFDLVMFPESIGYFELKEVLPGVARVLKPRGDMLMTAYPTNFASDRIYKNRSVEQLTRELREMGFQVADQKLLIVKRNSIKQIFAEDRAQIIYILARKSTLLQAQVNGRQSD